MEYYCELCSYDLCLFCKENYVYDINIVDYQIFIYFRKVNCYLIVEICVRYYDVFYERYCKLCKFFVCCYCMEYRKYDL